MATGTTSPFDSRSVSVIGVIMTITPRSMRVSCAEPSAVSTITSARITRAPVNWLMIARGSARAPCAVARNAHAATRATAESAIRRTAMLISSFRSRPVRVRGL